jgi:hypothetical protein
MPDDKYEPNADTLRQTVLNTIARHNAAVGRVFSVDAKLADDIATNLLARLASLKKRQKHAKGFEVQEALIAEFGILRQHAFDISNAVMKVIDMPS